MFCWCEWGISLLLKNYGGFFIYICFFLDLLEWKNLNELE